MKIHVFDVGHGFCSMVTAPNGKRILIDCGIRSEPFWSPSLQYTGEAADALYIMNLDADHLSNYKWVREMMKIGTVVINNTIDAARLASLKHAGMSAGVEALYKDLIFHPEIFNGYVDLSPISVYCFRFPYTRFPQSANNLSLVVFIVYAGFSMLFPGDLEKEGWEAFLAAPPPGFIDLLRRVNLVVTSHHGRDNGRCDRLFPLCNPDAFIISDKEIVHETQETTGWYCSRAKGLPRIIRYSWEKPETRYVFTTRSDKCLSISVETNGYYVLGTNCDFQKDFSEKPKAAAASSPVITRPTIPVRPRPLVGLSDIGIPPTRRRLSSLASLLSPPPKKW